MQRSLSSIFTIAFPLEKHTLLFHFQSSIQKRRALLDRGLKMEEKGMLF